MTRAAPAVALLLGLAMVSRIPYVHLMNQYVAGKRSFGHLVRITLFFIVCLIHVQIALVCMFCGFALSGPINALRHRWQRVREKAGLREGSVEASGGD